MGHWLYPGEFDPNDWFGFIYRVIDTTNNREYIGKKQFFSHITKAPLKGKTRKRKIKKESDWRSYTTSSTHVNDAILEKGKDKFLFLIESLHANKSSLHYGEVEAQILEDVLRTKLPCGTRKYYNGMIGNIKFIPKEETPEERLARVRDKKVVFGANTILSEPEWVARYRPSSYNRVDK